MGTFKMDVGTVYYQPGKPQAVTLIKLLIICMLSFIFVSIRITIVCVTCEFAPIASVNFTTLLLVFSSF